jgi:DNA-directed RNA polymerase subunit K/omega
MIQRPDCFGKFEFAVMASLRAVQLTRGCVPKVDGDHTVAVMAQLEIAQGQVPLMPADAVAGSAAASALSEQPQKVEV